MATYQYRSQSQIETPFAFYKEVIILVLLKYFREMFPFDKVNPDKVKFTIDKISKIKFTIDENLPSKI
jgi:hypothetical protein